MDYRSWLPPGRVRPAGRYRDLRAGGRRGRRQIGRQHVADLRLREATSNGARQHWLAERLLDRSPMLTAHLKPTFFAEWVILAWGQHGDHGVLRLPFGTSRHARVAGADQSYMIAAILENPEPHDRQAYPLYGPVEMDHYGIADAVSRALGIPVTYDPISVEEFAAGLASAGRSPHLIQHLSNVAIDYQNGIFSGVRGPILRVVDLRSRHAHMRVAVAAAVTPPRYAPPPAPSATC